MFSTLLIANRGEIARRIIRTARRMGITCVSIYSDADVDAPHVHESDAAINVGPAAADRSYLNIDAIMDAAAETGADAIHPGYGFLSENADFAEACARAGIVFVGPRAETIRAMGEKDHAKEIMAGAGVPVVPGVNSEDQSDRRLMKAAQEIGFPILIKAVAGGGGKGLRRVDAPDAFALALASARREARNAFGDDRMIVEKLMENPRHIEVQVFGDAHGNHVHFFERDCSLQRRHQKVIEEAPAPGLSDEVRAALCETAVKAAKAVDYVNAGTVEFIVSPNDAFAFIEMNTRLQVEHPVTEMVTGADLVELQLKIAAGETLPAQDDIRLGGHAIEARVYAEDPAAGFRPSTGAITRLDIDPPRRAASQARLRWDAGLEPGGVVSSHYDATIGKLIAWGATREAAADGLREALERTRIAPVRSNAGFLARCLAHPDVRAGRADTGLIGREGEALLRPAPNDIWTRAALAGVARYARRRSALRGQAMQDPWNALDGWRLNAPPRVGERFSADDDAMVVELSFPTGAKQLFDDWTPVEMEVGGVRRAGETRLIGLDRVGLRFGEEVEVEARIDLGDGVDSIDLFFQGDCVLVRAARPEAAAAAFEAGDVVSAPMPGRVAEVRATPGVEVSDGEPLLVLEAMKMEHALPAPRAGRVAEVRARAGSQVREGDVLVRLEPLDDEGVA